MNTEQQGPFFIEWGVNCIVVRSKQPFSAELSMKVQAEQQAAIFALPPMGLQKGMRLILSTVGHDDVIIEPKGDL